jgi:hypothetical protein
MPIIFGKSKPRGNPPLTEPGDIFKVPQKPGKTGGQKTHSANAYNHIVISFGQDQPAPAPVVAHVATGPTIPHGKTRRAPTIIPSPSPSPSHHTTQRARPAPVAAATRLQTYTKPEPGPRGRTRPNPLPTATTLPPSVVRTHVLNTFKLKRDPK